MTIRQTSAAKGQASTPAAFQAGLVTTAIFKYTFNESFVAADDQLELGLLPADVQIIGATIIGTGLGAITANVGVMAGTPSDTVGTRAVGTQLFSAITVNNAENNATLTNCLTVAPNKAHRALGLTLSADVAAGGAKTVTVRVEYVA